MEETCSAEKYKQILENIAATEETILFDTSLKTHSQIDFFYDILYDARRFRDINLGPASDQVNGLKIFFEFISNKNVKTVSGVVKELKDMLDLTSDKTHNLNYHAEIDKAHYIKPQYEDEKARNAMGFLCSYHSKLFHRASKSIINPNTPEYELLKDFIIKVSKNAKSKRDFTKYYQPNLETKKKEDLKTDEELVACSFYLASQGRKNIIVTRDSDIERIAFDTMDMLNCVNPLGQKFLQNLKTHYSRVFFIKDEGKLFFDSTKDYSTLEARLAVHAEQ